MKGENQYHFHNDTAFAFEIAIVPPSEYNLEVLLRVRIGFTTMESISCSG
jgi:hypothetical protein